MWAHNAFEAHLFIAIWGRSRFGERLVVGQAVASVALSFDWVECLEVLLCVRVMAAEGLVGRVVGEVGLAVGSLLVACSE